MAILIVAVGGSIRINDAGESCPDWPKCFGTYGFDISPEEQGKYWEENPDQIDSRGENHRYTVFEIFVEWFHRLLVGIVAIPIIMNLIISRRKQEIYGKSNYYASIFITLAPKSDSIIVQYGPTNTLVRSTTNKFLKGPSIISINCIFS